MQFCTEEIRARLDLRELAVNIGIRPKRRSNRSGPYQRFHCPSPLHPKGDANGDSEHHEDALQVPLGELRLLRRRLRSRRARVAGRPRRQVHRDRGVARAGDGPRHRPPRAAPPAAGAARHRAASNRPPPPGARSSRRRGPRSSRASRPPPRPRRSRPRRSRGARARGGGLDPEGVAEAGARDWSAAWPASRPILDEYTREELEDAGLCRRDGAKTKWCPPLWGGPARKKFPRCLAVPVRNVSGDVIAFRFRLYRPKPGRAKELTSFGSVGPDGFALGAEAIGGARTLVVCEGVPDYLAAKQAAELPEGHALWASCAVSSLPDQLASLLAAHPSIEAIELLAHHDRDKRTRAPIPLARVPAWKNLAEARRGPPLPRNAARLARRGGATTSATSTREANSEPGSRR